MSVAMSLAASADAPVSWLAAQRTASNVVAGHSLAGTTAIVTGGSFGVGLETAIALAGAGANVIVPTRTPRMARILIASTADGLEIEPLDLADARSINAFASRFLASGRALSILINAVSTTATPWLQRDARGNETQLSVNHLGHFQLVARLWPALQRAQGARIVSVFNRHRLSPIDFDDVNFERRRYDQRIAHGQSKTANLLFAVALDARGERYGIRALSLHAGTVLRPFARLLSTDVATSGVFDDEGNTIVVEKADLRTAAQSAATAVWCATSASLEGLGGLYCEDCGVAPVVTDDANERYGVKRWAVDPDLAERLWCVSQGLAGVRFPRNQGDVEHAR